MTVPPVGARRNQSTLCTGSLWGRGRSGDAGTPGTGQVPVTETSADNERSEAIASPPFAGQGYPAGTAPASPTAIDGGLEWLDLGENVLAFRRNEHTTIVNLSDRAIDLPASPSLTSIPLVNGQLPPDAAAWLG